MNQILTVVAILVIGIGGVWPRNAIAADPPPSSMPTVVAPHPWEKAQAVLRSTEADLRTGGIMAVQPHLADLEQALGDANQSFAPRALSGDTAYVLADGPSETLLALSAAAGEKNLRKTVAVQNPYPAMSLYLGSYYDEIGKPDEALRVLDFGLSLTAVKGEALGAHQPFLFAERGAALSALKRWPDMLADYEEGLKLPDLKEANRARLLRGRGFALTQLGRLDDAEKSYRDSLISEPGNALAQHELQYIAGLRAGAPPTATKLILPNASKPK